MDRQTAVTTWREACGSDPVVAMSLVTTRILEDFAQRIEAHCLSAWQEAQRQAWAASADLRADLVSCRGTVKTELNHYERLAMVHGKTALAASYEAEAQRLSALLERIDALGKTEPGGAFHVAENKTPNV